MCLCSKNQCKSYGFFHDTFNRYHIKSYTLCAVIYVILLVFRFNYVVIINFVSSSVSWSLSIISIFDFFWIDMLTEYIVIRLLLIVCFLFAN